MEKKLRDQHLLEDLNDQELAQVAKIIKNLNFKEGEYLFKEKNDTKGLYLIVSGKVTISKVTPDGWTQTLAVFTKGHFFGELSILEHRHHEASAVATEDTELFLFGKKEFERLEKERSDIAFKIIKKIALIVCKNLRRMNDTFMKSLVSY
jgi:CRP/FNR family transcriptional regulator